ncbi:response regulator transcription factor [Christensenella intestinihominis]|uniref:response regulator transcription factor n=1 Tax=Christensenella intestinihominis TaxID=1851429 RepID=UPI00082CA7A0|nr:response regulator transcription factor [Christensenella intestinihominis]
MAYIAVVEDDASVRELILCTLKSAKFTVDTYECGEDFLEQYEKHEEPDVILLDIMLPGIDGFEVFRRLSSQSGFDVPVIFLTARTTEVDKVSGLNLGADDYITKPFGVLELIARVNAVLRRAKRTSRPQQPIELGGLKIDVSAHTLYVDGEKTELTYKEFEMLRYFMRNPGLVLTREMLLNEIWGIDTDIETRTVDMHIKTLRQKIGRCGECIKTVRGVGYRLEV